MFTDSLLSDHIDFVKKQHMFFVATAPADGRINLSPKGMDTLRIVNENRVSWLNLTGSGNETAAHLYENGRITLMMCAFEGKPNILRIYGTGRCIHPHDATWEEHIGRFPFYKNARQIVEIEIHSVQTSCGFAVPRYEFVEDRAELDLWAKNRSEEEIRDYWSKKNTKSIDGKETGIFS